MTGNEQGPQGQAELPRVGGREVLLGLSRRDYHDLCLARRRIEAYIEAGHLVHPDELELVGMILFRLTEGPVPWHAHAQ